MHTDQGDITREVPAIVAPELQQKALGRLEENKTKRSERAKDRKYLLRGLVRCEVCGRNFAGSSSTAKGRRYHYYNAAREGRSAAIHNCPRVSAPWLEEVVWADVRRFAQNPGEVLEQLTAQIERENAASDLLERRADLLARLEEAEQEKARVLGAFKKGILDEGDLEIALPDVKNTIANLHLLLANVESKLEQVDGTRLAAERTLAYLAALRGKLEEIEGDSLEAFLARRELVQLLVQGKDVGRNDAGRVKVSVTYKFGPPPEDPDGDSVYGVTHTKESILKNAESRLGNSREEEIEVALGEIAKIARLRLRELVATDEALREIRARR